MKGTVLSSPCPAVPVEKMQSKKFAGSPRKPQLSLSGKMRGPRLAQGKIRLRQREDEKYYAVKTLRFVNEEEVIKISERKKRSKAKRIIRPPNDFRLSPWFADSVGLRRLSHN